MRILPVYVYTLYFTILGLHLYYVVFMLLNFNILESTVDGHAHGIKQKR